jgi:hypothetical protein
MCQQLGGEGLLEFDEPYLESLYAASDDTLKKSTNTWHTTSQWALGPLYNSFKGIYRLAGPTVRQPGGYAPISLTCETIHASVRVRLGLIGPGTKAPKPWVCDALKGWKLIGVDTDGDGVVDIGCLGSKEPIRWEFNSEESVPEPKRKRLSLEQRRLIGIAATKESAVVQENAQGGGVGSQKKILNEDCIGDMEIAVAGPEYAKKVLKIVPQGKPGDAGMGMPIESLGKRAAASKKVMDKADDKMKRLSGLNT